MLALEHLRSREARGWQSQSITLPIDYGFVLH
jgi:hypothetical protein